MLLDPRRTLSATQCPLKDTLQTLESSGRMTQLQTDVTMWSEKHTVVYNIISADVLRMVNKNIPGNQFIHFLTLVLIRQMFVWTHSVTVEPGLIVVNELIILNDFSVLTQQKAALYLMLINLILEQQIKRSVTIVFLRWSLQLWDLSAACTVKHILT